MGTRRQAFRVAGGILASAVWLGGIGVLTPAAFAAKPSHSGSGGGGAAATGNDISYPQCGASFPSSPGFGIVGLNDGRANDLNPCFGLPSSTSSYDQSELYWAVATPTGTSTQPKASLYVNTGDPGDVYNGTLIADWPTSGSTPYGTCSTATVPISGGSAVAGDNTPACAWEYGYQTAVQDVSWLANAAAAINNLKPSVTVPGGASSYLWWLDVETGNTWQSGASGQAMNVADLQGMIAGLDGSGAAAAAVGVYSTSYQWDQITGGTPTAASGSLYGISDWIPGARTLSGAESNCAAASFTGGRVTVTQWTGSPDNDYAC